MDDSLNEQIVEEAEQTEETEDVTSNLFEHIKHRLPTGYEFGDDGTIIDDNLVPNHKTFQNSLRQDHEGDVGIFETYMTEQPKYNGYSCYIGEVQIAVVTKNGDIDSAKEYLIGALNNIRTNTMSSSVYVKSCKLTNIKPVGKNDSNFQMVVLNIYLKYLLQ